MSTYNLTPYMESKNLVDLALATNGTLGGHIFGTFLLVVTFTVAFLALKSKGMFTSESALVAMWATMIICIMLRPLDLVSNMVFWTTLLMTPAFTAILYLSGTPY